MQNPKHPLQPERLRRRPARRASLLGSLLLFGGVGTFVALSTAEPAPEAASSRSDAGPSGHSVALAAFSPELPAVSAAPPSNAPAPSEVASPAPDLRITEGVISRGTTLARALSGQGVSSDVVHVIAREMRPLFDFRRARPGHRFRLSQDDLGRVVDFRYRTTPTSSYRMSLVGEGYSVRQEEAVLMPRPARLSGVIASSLYRAVTDQGEHGQLARDFADVFAWDVDFQRSVQPGDAFRILYEKLYRLEDDGSEAYVRPGRILAARYEGVAGRHTAFYFEREEGVGGYYRPDGTSVERQFLMAPLRHARISSRYTSARRHPILKITRPHHGIDYAAPVGTPVWSVAEGEVIFRGRAGGFGNLVKVRHSNGYVSYYSHLSRFAKGLRRGDKVGQKQVIGYVGQTGLATGPHVCFRIARNGQYVNPARLRTPAGDPVPNELFSTFRSARDVLLAELDAGELVVASEESL